MKKTILFAVAALMLSACSETLNDKAEALIKSDMEKTLVNPDTYHAIETKTDSAFAPYDNPDLFTLFLDIAGENVTISRIEQSIQELKDNMKNAETGMSLASMKKDENYRASYDKFKKYYDECKKQIADIEPQMDSVTTRIEQKVEMLNKLSSVKRQFIGYKSVHRYSAENSDGKELSDSCYYLFDKDMKKVVLSLPLDKYRMMIQSVKTIGGDSIK